MPENTRQSKLSCRARKVEKAATTPSNSFLLIRFHHDHLAGFIDPVDNENLLGQINANSHNCHGLLSAKAHAMRCKNRLVARHCRLATSAPQLRDEEVPFYNQPAERESAT
nr:hypothetical protein [Derxia gummosa]